MKTRRLILTLALVFGMAGTSLAQAFETTSYTKKTDYNHYSIEKTQEKEYVCAGTQFYADGTTDMHVFKLDIDGNLLWERKIQKTKQDRALDVMIDPDQNIVITGFISVKENTPNLYVVKLDPSGNYLADRTYKIDKYRYSIGTNIIYSKARKTYIVGGTFANSIDGKNLYKNESFIIELEPSLGYVNHKQYEYKYFQHSSINDIVETPEGYFITGSIGTKGIYGEDQAVLAATINFDLDITNNLSFESSDSKLNHVGVSLVYDREEDYIYLMSNNSEYYNPQITVIKDVSGSPSIVTNYVLVIDETYGKRSASGFQLRKSNDNSRNLVAAGYFKTYDGKHSYPWIAEFKKRDGARVDGLLWPAPSPLFHAHGGGILSTFEEAHPYIFNQEIMTTRIDKKGYVFIGPRDVDCKFSIDVVATVGMKVVECFELLKFKSKEIDYDKVRAETFQYEILKKEPKAKVSKMKTTWKDFCPSLGKCAPISILTGDRESAPSGISEVDEFTVSPNPFKSDFVVEITGDNLNGQLILVNSIGQVVYTSENLQGNYVRETINVDGLENGIYFLKFYDGQNEVTRKIIKQ